MTDTDDRQRAREWWRTEIIDIEPGQIRVRGYPIESLIGSTGFASMIWLMLRGELPDPERAALLEAALVASVDHGPQAPAIAIARMAATCGVGLNNALASGINALGDVHGGAGQQAMELYQEIGQAAASADLAETVPAVLLGWSERHGKHVPGFGHRFHPIDPRAVRLLDLLDSARARGCIGGRFVDIGRAVEATLAQRKGRRIPMNIDGVTAVVFCELGFAPPLGRGLFVLSRAVGVLAHAWEQSQQGGRIKGPTPPDFGYLYCGPAQRSPADPAADTDQADQGVKR